MLVAGGDLDAVQALRARLAARGAQVTALARGRRGGGPGARSPRRPRRVVALGAAEAELRDRLDPLGLRAGPAA